MPILENFENAWDIDLQPTEESLATKIFSETVCSECQYESNPMLETDNMGRDTSMYKE